MKKFYSTLHSQSVHCKFLFAKGIGLFATIILLIFFNNSAQAQALATATGGTMSPSFGGSACSTAGNIYFSTITIGSVSGSTVTNGSFYTSGTCGTNPLTNLTANTPAVVVAGETYTISVTSSEATAGSGAASAFAAWADWANDGNMLEANDNILPDVHIAVGSAMTASATFTVPFYAVGNCRLRMCVMSGGNTGSTNPAGLQPFTSQFTNLPGGTGAFTASSFFGEYLDFTINVTAAPACSSTPTSYTVSPSSQSTCNGTSAIIALPATGIAVSGLQFQWMSSSTSGSGYTNVAGGTGATSYSYTTAATQPSNPTYYVCQVTCPTFGSTNSSQATVNVTPFNQCYCVYNNTTTPAAAKEITNVTLVGNTITLNNTPTQPTAAPEWKQNYSTNVPDLTQGGTYTLTVKAGTTTRQNNTNAWIDWDQSGTFGGAGAVNEFIGGSINFNGATNPSASFTFTVPAGATPGQTALRVNYNFNATTTGFTTLSQATAITNSSYSTNSPCVFTGTVGSTYDFLVNVVSSCTPPTVASGSPTAYSTTAGFTDIQINNFTTGSGSNVLIVARQGGSATAPTGGTTYTAATGSSIALSAGQALGTGHIIWNGAWTSGTTTVDVTGLASGVAYTFDIYDYNTGPACYAATYTPTAVTTLSCTPPSASSTPTPSAQTNSSINVAWSGGGGANTLVVARQGGSATAPTNGLGYTGATGSSIALTSGQALGTGFIVYNGSGNSGNVTVTGLAINTSYSFDVYSYNTSPFCYATTATGTTTTTNVMNYVSSTTTQNSVTVGPNTTSDEIVGLQVVTVGATSALQLTSITFNTTGSSSPGTDIVNAKLWVSNPIGTSTFSTGTATLLATITSPNGSYTINAGSTPALSAQTLSTGTNYFWLTYDIQSVVGGVILSDNVKAAITGIQINSSNPSPALSSTATATDQILLSYCTPTGATNILGNGTVTEFKIVDPSSTVLIDKTTSAGASCCAYIDYTAIGTPALTQGVTYTISGARQDDGGGIAFNYGMGIWVDYNDDGTFTTGTNVEQIYLPGLSSTDAFSFSYTVPTTGISAGVHRLRIRTHFSDAAPTPCGNLASGAQGMDFLVNILSAAPTAYAVTGGPSCGSATVGVANSQTGVNYQLFLGATPVGSPVAGTGSAISFTATNPQTTAGTYTVVGTDASSHTTQMTGNAIVNANPTPTASAGTGAGGVGTFCSYETVSLTSSLSGLTYLWSNSATTQNQTFLASGHAATYTVTVTDSHTCTGTASAVVTVNTPATTVVSPTTANPCSADVTPITSSGSVNYSWAPSGTLDVSTGANVNATPPTSTTYTVTGTDANNCTSSATSTFTVRPIPTITVNPPSAVCTGTLNSTLIASGGVSTGYTWLPNLFINTNTGTTVTAQISDLTFYTVTGTGANGCTANSDPVPVATVPAGGSALPAFSVICSGSTKLLTASGEAGNSYQWQISTNNVKWTDITGATATSYTTKSGDGTTKKYYRLLAQSDACYNVASSTAVVDISVTPLVTITALTSTSATVSWSPYGTGQYNISWSGAAGSGSASAVTTNNFLISPLTANGDLLVTVTPVTPPTCGGVTGSSVSTHTLCAIPTMTNVVATVTGHGFTANWTTVSGATAYRLFYRDLYTQSTWSFTDVTGTTATVSVLYGGHTFAVYVAAKNCPGAGNIGDGSTPLNYVTTNPGSACSPAPTVSSSSSCPNQIHVDISGTTPPYNLILRRISPGLTSGVSYPINTTSVDITVGTQYAGSTWEIFASKNCGGGSTSILSDVSLVTVKPGCPTITNLVLSHPTCYGFTASWNPNDCSGLGITGYQLLIKKNGSANFTGYPVGTATHATVGWLPTGLTWNVEVMSIACNGASSALSVPDTITSLGCGRTGDDQQAATSQSISGNDKEAVTVYPNPTEGQFWVNLGSTTNREATVKIELVNQLGQVVQTNISQMTNGMMNQLVNTPQGLATGIYFVRTSVEGNVYVNRLMISKE